MRRLIESLTPDDRPLSWRRVGGMFALYVLLMATAGSVFVSHESARKLAHDPAATVATGAKSRSLIPAPVQVVAGNY